MSKTGKAAAEDSPAATHDSVLEVVRVDTVIIEKPSTFPAGSLPSQSNSKKASDVKKASEKDLDAIFKEVQDLFD